MELFNIQRININYKKFYLVVLISLNIFLLNGLNLDLFDQILNLLISFGIFSYFNEKYIKESKYINTYQIIISFSILLITLYRSYWLHIGDNFIYLFFLNLFISFLMISYTFSQIISNFRPLLICSLFPLSKILFIPLAILLSPFSTFFTWLLLNTFGFLSVMRGQEIFYNNSGINISFSCSGAGQVIFCLTAMLMLNFLFPLSDKRLLIFQLLISFFFTFSVNILRLFVLTIFAHTAEVEGFSMFNYLHGGNGGLFFSLFSTILSCESYKRLYLRNK